MEKPKNPDDFYSRDDVWQSKDVSNYSIRWIILILILLFLGLGLRAFSLQIVQGKYFKDLSSGNRLRRIFVLPPRGSIIDKNGEELAQNVPIFALVISPVDLEKDMQKRDNTYLEIKKELNLDIKERVENFLSKGSEDEIDFATDIDHDKALILKEKWAKLSGISIEERFRRNYSPDVSNILGYVGPIQSEEWQDLKDRNYLLFEWLGKTGIEAIYQNELRGILGAKEVEVDAFGKVKKVLANKEPIVGDGLKLTLDYNLQKKAKEILFRKLSEKNLKKGSLVALDPKTGGVLAMVSLPDYDNNAFIEPNKQEEAVSYLQDENQPMFNRAAAGVYPSGSTIKPVIAAAALQENIVNENTNLFCGPSLDVPNQYDPEIVYHYNENKASGYGYTDVKKAIASSVNVFFYQIGGGYQDFKGLGANNLKKYMAMFGLGEKTGLDIPNESSGLIPTPQWKQQNQQEPWYLGDTYNLSIGQGNLLVTPLQVARYTMVIANWGTLYEPHFLDKIIDSQGKVIKTYAPTGTKINIDENNLRIVRQGMRQTVTDGSGNQLQSLKITSAAKTGTAEDPAHSDEPHSWFTSFAPYDDPGIVLTVMAENAGEGYDLAEPIAKELLEWWQDNR